MSGLQVFLLGKFRVCRDGEALTDLHAVKAQELFCFLLLHQERPHHREELAGILWENAPAAQSKQYLRRALWQLQAALSRWLDSSQQPVIEAQNDWLQWQARADVWVDALCFEACGLEAREVTGDALDEAAAQQLQTAVELYRSDLLSGWYQDWCLFERERLHQIYLSSLDKLMGYFEKKGAYETAIAYGMNVLRADRAREHTHRHLMRLHYLAGNRTGALQQYDACRAILAGELGVQPSPATIGLYEQLCRAESIEWPGAAPAPDDASLMLRLQAELQQLGQLLRQAQQQIQAQIEIVEATLKRIS